MVNDVPTDRPKSPADPRRVSALQAESDEALGRGRFLDALPLLQTLTALLQSLYGPETPKIVPLLRSAAQCQEKVGLPREAEAGIELSLRLNEKTPIASAPDIAQDLFLLGALLLRHRRFSEAEAALTRGLKLTRIVHGDTHAETARAWTRWGDYCAEASRPDDAAESYGKSLDLWRRLPPEEALDQGDTLARQARLFARQGRVDRAETLLRECLAQREKAWGPDAAPVAADRLALARHYNSQKLFRKSLPLLEQALAARQKLFGNDHPEMAEALLIAAEAQDLQGDMVQAEDFQHRALGIYERCHGPHSPALAGCLNDLAGLYYDHGHYAEAEPLIRRALEIMQRVYAPGHPEVTTGLGNLAATLTALGRRKEADALRPAANATAAPPKKKD